MRVTFAIFLLVIGVCLGETNIWNSFRSKINNIRKKVSSNLKEILEVKNEEYPKFCHNLKCPKFTIKSKGDGYEERCYEESTWATTSIQAPHTQKTSFRPMFQTLFKYISGENDQKVKIPMTVPVLVAMKMSTDKNDSLDVKMHFFVPPTNLTIPKPTSDAVKILSYPKVCTYVRVFGGYQMEINKNLLYQRKKLTNALDKAGLKYQESLMVYAGYDSPWKVFHRHNEIMLGVKSEETNMPSILSNEISPHVQSNDVV